LFLGTAVFAQDHGSIVLEVDLKNAPKTGKSFLETVDAGTYNGLIFHRVIPEFMIQGGGFTSDVKPVPTEVALMNEADNGLKNLRGTVAMARRQDPHSASIQFFINLVDNVALDHTSKTPQGWGYAVFARVVEGMEVADTISKVMRGRVGPYDDVPIDPVVIESAKRLTAEAPAPE
jgi:cyclophilin family peptidyl-prolyl cis-trans isomerase